MCDRNTDLLAQVASQAAARADAQSLRQRTPISISTPADQVDPEASHRPRSIQTKLATKEMGLAHSRHRLAKSRYIIRWEKDKDGKLDVVELSPSEETKDLLVEDRWHRFTPVPLAVGAKVQVTSNGKTCTGVVTKCTPGDPRCEVQWSDGLGRSIVPLHHETEDINADATGFSWHRLDKPPIQSGDTVAVLYDNEYWVGLVLGLYEEPPELSQRCPPPLSVSCSSSSNSSSSSMQLPPSLMCPSRKRRRQEEEDEDDRRDGLKGEDEDGEGRMRVETILGRKREGLVDLFLVKFVRQSYLKVKWYNRAQLDALGASTKVENWLKRHTAYDSDEDPDEKEYFSPAFTEVERVVRVEDGPAGRRMLVKWRGLSYEECTWESPQELDAPRELALFLHRHRRPAAEELAKPPRPTVPQFVAMKQRLVNTKYKNGNQLRDYQVEGFLWLTYSWIIGKSSILCDEMGLGKTVQVIAFLQFIVQRNKNRGPFLIVAPLSTLGHWQREIEGWSDLNAVMYHGNQASRDLIFDTEFYFFDEAGAVVPGATKFHVLVTTYELVSKDLPRLAQLDFEVLVLDEGHRVKNSEGILFQAINEIRCHHKVILTGTPIQNQIGELFTLLNLLDPKVFASKDAFLRCYGQMTDSSTVKQLHKQLQPYLLRRVKEDVERSIPPKTETLVKVRLTREQRVYYKAVMENNREFLYKGVKSRSNVPRLVNLMMQLRKVCNHPYLLQGAEEKLAVARRPSPDQVPQLVRVSSKMGLLDKLLVRLRQERRRVLVFSQMTRMLDILEDYVRFRAWPYERLDGSVMGSLRQSAIDRFCDRGHDAFVFLLSTKAGGVGINLTAADTVIIFDSDWNPQNDIQAQSRVHRIGQTSDVRVYRFITEDTYEEKMFEVASKKLGLDRAVLAGRVDEPSSPQAGGGTGGAEKLGLTPEEINLLLRGGAYALYKSEEDEDVQEEDLDRILQRATTVSVSPTGVQGLSSFSRAVFSEGSCDDDLSDAEFWDRLLPEVLTAKGLLKRLQDPATLANPEQKEKFVDDLRTLAEKCLEWSRDKNTDAAQQAEINGMLKVLELVEYEEFGEEFSETRRILEKPRARKSAQAVAEQRTLRDLPPSPEMWTAMAVLTFVEKFATLGWGAWERLRAEAAYSCPIAAEQVQCLAEAVAQVSMVHHTRRHGAQHHHRCVLSLMAFALKETDQGCARLLQEYRPLDSGPVRVEVSFARLKDVLPRLDEESHPVPADPWRLGPQSIFQAKPSDCPLAGQLVTVNLDVPAAVQEAHPAALVAVVLSFVPDRRHFAVPGLAEPMMRVCFLPPTMKSHEMMLPGYAQGYRLRACLVVPRGDGPDPAPSVAEYLQSGPPPAPLQVVPRQAMADREVLVYVETFLRQKAALGAAALNALFQRYGPNLEGIDERLEGFVQQAGADNVPSWFKPGAHDLMLLKGLKKHGVGVHYARLLRDPALFAFGPREVAVDKPTKTALDDRLRRLLLAFSDTYRALHELAAIPPEDRDEEAEEKGPRSFLESVRKTYGSVIRRVLLTHGLCPDAEGRTDWQRFKAADPSLAEVPIAHLEAHIIDAYFSAPWRGAANPFGIPLVDDPAGMGSGTRPGAAAGPGVGSAMEVDREAREEAASPPKPPLGKGRGKAEEVDEATRLERALDNVRTSVALMAAFRRAVCPRLFPAGGRPGAAGEAGPEGLMPDVVLRWSGLATSAMRRHRERGVVPPPKWWAVDDDWDLLRGVHRHGLDLKYTLMDPGLRFYHQRVQLAEAKRRRDASKRTKRKAEGEGEAEAGAGPDPAEDEPREEEAEPERDEVEKEEREEKKERQRPRAPGGLVDKLPPLFVGYQKVLMGRLAYLVAACLGRLLPDAEPASVVAEAAADVVGQRDAAGDPQLPKRRGPRKKVAEDGEEAEGGGGSAKKRKKKAGAEPTSPPADPAVPQMQLLASAAERGRAVETGAGAPQAAATATSVSTTTAPPSPVSAPTSPAAEPPADGSLPATADGAVPGSPQDAPQAAPPRTFLDVQALSEMEEKRRRKYVRSGMYRKDHTGKFVHSAAQRQHPARRDDKVADSTGDSPPAPPSLGVPGLEPPPPLGPLQQQQQQQQLLLQQLYRQGLSLQAHPLQSLPPFPLQPMLFALAPQSFLAAAPDLPPAAAPPAPGPSASPQPAQRQPAAQPPAERPTTASSAEGPTPGAPKAGDPLGGPLAGAEALPPLPFLSPATMGLSLSTQQLLAARYPQAATQQWLAMQPRPLVMAGCPPLSYLSPLAGLSPIAIPPQLLLHALQQPPAATPPDSPPAPPSAAAGKPAPAEPPSRGGGGSGAEAGPPAVAEAPTP